jgi:spermidine/putrescine-binding protein
MKRVAALCLLLAAGCPKSSREQTLRVYIWTLYHSPAAVARFEELHHARVVIDTYDNNEVIEQKLASGQAAYDIVVPSDYMVLALAREGLIRPLDPARLSNLGQIDPRLDSLKDRLPERFGVPYLFGTTGFGYRIDKIKDRLDSFGALFDPRFAGKIVMLDDIREVFAAALKVDGHSMNSTRASDLEAAKHRLLEQKPLVLAYDSSDFVGKLTGGDAWIVHGYSGDLARAARSSKGAIRYVVPKEGGTLSVDHLVIPKNAEHVDLAYAFIDFMLDPEVAAETTEDTGYATANAGARPKIKAEIAQDPAVFPPSDVLSRCEPIKDLGSILPKLDQMWTEVKAR